MGEIHAADTAMVAVSMNGKCSHWNDCLKYKKAKNRTCRRLIFKGQCILEE